MSNTQGDPNVIVIKNARLSYSAIFTPRKGGGDDGKDKDPRYQASLILDKTTQKDMIKEVRRVIKQVAETKWPGKSVINKPDGKLISGDGTTNKLMLLSVCLHDGAEKADKDGYGDHVMFVSASRGIKDSKGTEMAPLPVVDKKNQPVDPRSGLIYDGCAPGPSLVMTSLSAPVRSTPRRSSATCWRRTSSAMPTTRRHPRRPRPRSRRASTMTTTCD
jgi:hypothetical protein